MNLLKTIASWPYVAVMVQVQSWLLGYRLGYWGESSVSVRELSSSGSMEITIGQLQPSQGAGVVMEEEEKEEWTLNELLEDNEEEGDNDSEDDDEEGESEDDDEEDDDNEDDDENDENDLNNPNIRA